MSANEYTHINANTAGVAITPQACQLYAVTINTKGATSNLLTLYDGTSTAGSVIAVIDTTVTYGSLFFKCQCRVGLFAVLAAGTAADITILTN